MSDFDLKKYLVENKLTTLSKTMDEGLFGSADDKQAKAVLDALVSKQAKVTDMRKKTFSDLMGGGESTTWVIQLPEQPNTGKDEETPIHHTVSQNYEVFLIHNPDSDAYIMGMYRKPSPGEQHQGANRQLKVNKKLLLQIIQELGGVYSKEKLQTT